jgi:transcriptional regulator with XRE-family HTH domain
MPHVLDLPDLDLTALPGMAAALAARDIAAVYRLLSRHGVAQRQIAAATGQSQSEVSEIIKGRQVQAYDVLVRICKGLGIPREAMGLSFGAYAAGSPVTASGEEDLEDVLRREFDRLLALAGVAAFGSAIPGVGSLGTAPTPVAAAAVPSSVGRADVVVVRNLTTAVADAARSQGGQAGPAAALAGWADQLLRSRASDKARRDLLIALSDLHVIAAWCCHDSAAPVQSHHHFSLAVDFATKAGDSYQASYALRHAAMMLLDRGRPNDALKLVQLAEVRLLDASGDNPRVAPLRCWLGMLSALAQAQMSGAGASMGAALSALARAQDGWAAPSLHARADFDLTAAMVHMNLGKVDAAEAMASTAVETFAAGNDRREGILADIVLARLHVVSGDRDAARLAACAIEGVLPTRSGVARAALLPLAGELETRRRSDLVELGRRARRVASVQ